MIKTTLTKWGKLGQLLPVLGIIGYVSGCLELPMLIQDSPRYGLDVAGRDSSVYADKYAARVDHLVSNIEQYTTAILKAFEGYTFDSDRCVFDNPHDFTEHIEVMLAKTVGAQGRWVRRYLILIDLDAPNYLSVYGHEFVRAVLFACDEGGLAWQDSGDWSGLPGAMWNDAETISVTQFPLEER